MRKYKILFAAGLVVFLAVTCVHAADLKKLMEVGASQADIAKTLQQETKNYGAVKKAIESGAIKEGISSDIVRKKYGEPIIEIYDKKRGLNKWLYMPATSTHFEGEKLYLYVDNENIVKEWELVNQ